MNNKNFLLIDCNNFFVSCERIFNPYIQDKPTIVLSNNDGCIVSRSNEAKALGFKMGWPIFKYKELLNKEKVYLFSSNFSLYQDISNRIMSLLKEFTSTIEIYSIDEAFISSDNADLTSYALEIKNSINKRVGIPISIGIASTKTLAKLANKKAKTSSNGVINFVDLNIHELDTYLECSTVSDIWGIGYQSTKFLNKNNVLTAREFKYAKDSLLKIMGVSAKRTQLELSGIKCIKINANSDTKKTIISSRTFSTPLKDYESIKNAIANYTCIACKKLQDQNSIAEAIGVYIKTNKHNSKIKQYKNFSLKKFPYSTSNTKEILHFAIEALKDIYKKDIIYSKAGVILEGIISNENIQRKLFNDENKVNKNAKLEEKIKHIKKLFGDEKIIWGSQGFNNEIHIANTHRSNRFTSNWNEIPIVN